MNIFSFFESLVRDIDTPPGTGEKGPPQGLLAFYWHFVKQLGKRGFHPRNAWSTLQRL